MKIIKDKHKKYIKQVKEFVDRLGFPEPFNYNADWYFLGYIKDNIKYVNVYRKYVDKSGKTYPRFIHILTDKDMRYSKTTVKFLLSVEKQLLAEGYDVIVTLVNKRDLRMRTLANKFGYVKWYESDDNDFMYKRIGD